MPRYAQNGGRRQPTDSDRYEYGHKAFNWIYEGISATTPWFLKVNYKQCGRRPPMCHLKSADDIRNA